MRLKALAVTAALIVGTAPQSNAADLIYGTLLPSTHGGTEIMQAFFDDLNANSTTVSWQMHMAGAMAGPRETLSAIRDGIIHGGHIVDAYTPSDLPRSNTIVQLAALAWDNLVATAAVNETMLLECETCLQELRDHSVIPLAYYSDTPQVLMCNREVANLEALQGTKVRAVGPFGVGYQSLGAVPVGTPVTELYDALQRGQVNCTSGSEIWLKDFRLAEVVDTVYNYPFGSYVTSHPFNMNADAWASLGEDDKALIKNRLAQLTADWAYLYVDDMYAARDLAIAEGLDYREMPADIVAAIEAYRAGQAERAIAWGKERGVDDAEQIVVTFLEKLDKWTAIVAEIGDDRDAYREALNREIFSKISF